MKNTYLNIKHGTLGWILSVLLTVIAGLLCSTNVYGAYTLKGSFDGWSSGVSMVAYPNNIYKAAIQKDGDGDVEFKITDGSAWYGKDSDNSVTREGTITGLNTSGGNCKVSSAYNLHTYLFEWNATDKSVKISDFDISVPASRVIYFDATNTGWAADATVKLNVGRANHVSNYSMSRVQGTRYLYKATSSKYDHASAWCISNANVTTNIYNYYSLGDKKSTCLYESVFENNKVYPVKDATETVGGNKVFQWESRKNYSTYAVTLTNDNTKGTLTVKDYDPTPASARTIVSGNNYSYLTELHITVSPLDGYIISSVMVGGVDRTVDAGGARGGTEITHTVTAATEVSVTYRSDATVLIAENETVTGSDALNLDHVTLNGYVEYTGCREITEHGFVYGPAASVAMPDEDNTIVKAGTAAIAGTHFTKEFIGDPGTYNYRAYIKSGDSYFFSSEVRQFTVTAQCNASAGFAALIGGGKSASAKSGTDGVVELTTDIHADSYSWACISATGNGATISTSDANITNGTSRNATVYATSGKTGTYKFKLTASCSSTDYLSEELTLYVCEPASAKTLLLDNHSANVICVGETSTATCISDAGYTYSLYHDLDNLGSYPGTGATLTWYNVSGEGTFYVKSSPSSFADCAVTVGSATQSYNRPTVELAVSPAASVMAYKDVTISKAGTSTVDTNLKWEITTNPGDKGYLLNTTRLLYDNRVRPSVIFKGGLVNGTNTTYTVSGTGSRTVSILDSSDTKTCEATGSVNIIVSPATETCGQ